jgi:O-antigen/teichoic acid export membrane protein
MEKDPNSLNNGTNREQDAELYSLIRQNSPYVVLERTLVPIINLLITILIIRKLTVDEYGIYKILLAVLSYVALITSLGLPGVFRRFIPEFFQKKELSKLKALVEKGLFFRIILVIGIVVIIIVFAEPIGNLLKFQQAMQYFAIFSIGIVFYLSSTLLASTLISVFQHKQYLIAQVIYVLFRGGLLYVLLSQGKGLVGLLISESASYGLFFLLFFIMYRRFLSSQSIKKRAKLPLRRLLKFGGFSYFNEAGAQILSVSTDYFIISAFLGPIAVGIYGFANRVLVLASRILPQSMFINIIRPAFYMKYVKHEDADQTNKMFNFLTKIICFVSLPMIVAIIIMGDKLIILVFDPKYLESLTVLWIVAGFHALTYFMEPIAIVLESKEKVQILFYSKIFAVYNLIGNLLVVKTYGVIGIAVVTGTAVLFKNLFCYWYAKKLVHVRLDFTSLAKIVVNTGIMGAFIYLLRPQVQNLISFAFIIFLGVIVYLGAAFVNKAFSSSERNILNRVLPRPLFVF